MDISCEWPANNDHKRVTWYRETVGVIFTSEGEDEFVFSNEASAGFDIIPVSRSSYIEGYTISLRDITASDEVNHWCEVEIEGVIYASEKRWLHVLGKIF